MCIRDRYQEQLNFARKKESQIDLVETKRLKLIDEIETLKKNITQANNQELNLKAQILSLIHIYHNPVLIRLIHALLSFQ